MAVPVARVHLKVAHGALPALLPTPPKWKILPLLPTTLCVAAVLPKPKPLAKPSRADSDERWHARKSKPAASAEPLSASSSSGLRSAGHGSSPRKSMNATSPLCKKHGRVDSVERWDAHKKVVVPASSSSSPGTSSLRTCSNSRASSSERWDVHKKRCPPQAELVDDDGESSSTGSNNIDTEEEEIPWKPRAMYAELGFTVAAPGPSMLPMPTTFLAVGVA